MVKPCRNTVSDSLVSDDLVVGYQAAQGCCNGNLTRLDVALQQDAQQAVAFWNILAYVPARLELRFSCRLRGFRDFFVDKHLNFSVSGIRTAEL